MCEIFISLTRNQIGPPTGTFPRPVPTSQLKSFLPVNKVLRAINPLDLEAVLDTVTGP